MRTSRSRRQQARIHMNHKIRGNARHRGRIAGFNDGFQEGYLRGRADVIMKIPREPIPMRPLHVCYVTTGKGYPYAPMDEGMRNTWQELVSQVSVCGPRDGVAAVAGQQRPDLVFALDGMELPVEQVDAVRELGIRTALWITDDPYYTDVMSSIVTHYDYVFTLEANSVDYYRSIGANVYFLPFGVYPGQFRPLRSPAKVRREISFIGSAYWSRIGMLEPILPELMKRGLVLSGLWWDRMPRYPQYARQIELNRWMDPYETSDTYNGSKIVINMHRRHDDETVNQNRINISAASPNPRTFEICACATLQLTDVRSDVSKFYTPGQEIETYSSPQEMLAKIDYYLSHEQERRDIALRALARTMRDHTYAHRLNQVLTTIFG
ncbi:glycosyltransferase [Paenibacillus dendritiformis]|nr:glycosyltransferase [Paenibacillus dendritiformis]NRF98443.1 glycosyltransferase [Paenibacillus dendritiformis]